MKAHPIIESPFRWIPMLVLALILVAFQVALVCGYTGNDYLPALVDGMVTIGWLAAIAYLAWFVVGLVSLFQTDVIMIIVGSLLWLAGSFMVCDIMVRIVGVSYVPFAQTIPFRLLFGLPVLIAITLWYRLIVTKEEVQNQELEKELDEMLDDIVQVLTGSAELEQIEIAGYYFHGLEIDMVEAFKEEYEDGTVWQHGVVRVIVKVEQKEM